MNSLDRSKYQVFEVIKYAHKFDKSIPEYDLDDRMREYYRVFANKTLNYKTYYFTKRTVERVSAMDYSSLKAADFLSIQSTNREKGVVLTGSENGMLNFGYVLTPQHVILGVYQRIARSSDVILLDNGKTDDYGFMSRFIGNVIVNEEGITYNPTSVITIAERMLNGDKSIAASVSKNILIRLKTIVKELERLNDKEDSAELRAKKLTEFTDRDLENAPNLRYELKAYFERNVLLRTAVKMFLFLKTASIIEQTYISEAPTCSYRRKPGEQRGYIRVDSTWDADITVLNPFVVRGHFRRQPKKNEKGEWIRVLIYIDSFMKNGYHRRAQKTINEEK